MENLIDSLQPYFDNLPYFLVAFIAAFLLTPLVGYFAKKFELVDLPNRMRKKGEKLPQRMHKKPLARGGGLAVIIPFLIISLFAINIDKQIVGMLLGVLILIVVGILDEKYELPGKYQLAAQLLAAFVVVVSGTSIDFIQNPLNGNFDLRIWELQLYTTEAATYAFAFPADIITICFIIIMINAVGWVFGIDALGEGIMMIVFFTITMISVKLGTPLTAVLSFILVGGLLGFIPYNFPPAKIMSGASGAPTYGFLIAVLSIISGAKVASSVIVLIIPLIDMVWVMLGRINRENVTNPIKLLRISDRTHLHHRLLDLGLSGKQVLIVEYIGIFLSSILAYYLSDLPRSTMIAVAAVIVLVIFFIISVLLKNGYKFKGRVGKSSGKDDEESEAEPPTYEEDTPESRYAY